MPETTGTGDGFGFRVALREDALIVGAPLDDDGAVRSGAAYVYVRDGSGWKLEQRLKAPASVSESRYGSAIAIEAQTAVVGAFSENHGGFSRAGAAYSWTNALVRTIDPMSNRDADDAIGTISLVDFPDGATVERLSAAARGCGQAQLAGDATAHRVCSQSKLCRSNAHVARARRDYALEWSRTDAADRLFR